MRRRRYVTVLITCLAVGDLLGGIYLYLLWPGRREVPAAGQATPIDSSKTELAGTVQPMRRVGQPR